MKRLFCCALLLMLLCSPVRAAEVSGSVALTFEEYTPHAVQTLERFGVKGTFFLPSVPPESIQQLLKSGHEIGLSLTGEADVTPLSRRQVYALLHTQLILLPEKYRPVWIQPPQKWGDALDQVARVNRLSLLGRSVDARQGLSDAMIDRIRSGDIVALGQISEERLTQLLEILRSRHLMPVTVSQLALDRDTDILPGKLYQKFPA